MIYRMWGVLWVAQCAYHDKASAWVENPLSGGLFRFPKNEVQKKATRLLQAQGWELKQLARRSLGLEMILALPPPEERLDGDSCGI